jgi:hypothetical protein
MSEAGTAGTRTGDDIEVIGDGAIRPFEVNVSQDALDDLRRRVGAMRWPERETVDDRTQGVQLASYQEGFFGDSWTWDGTDWTEHHPGRAPSARNTLGMAYDAGNGEVVLFGGWFYTYTQVFLDDTWSWDGTDWSDRSPGPPIR